MMRTNRVIDTMAIIYQMLTGSFGAVVGGATGLVSESKSKFESSLLVVSLLVVELVVVEVF